ncbi:MAG: RNA ligase partner protein [Candidatus Aenigmatarchaeota archaeon]
MKKYIKIILDTSIFINPNSHYIFGDTPSEAFNNFLEKAQNKKGIKFYIPPSIYEELMNFLENPPPLKKILIINKKPPSSYQLSISSLFVYELIEEIRIRVNKGLRIAEKYARKANKEHNLDALIKNLRQEYRVALREGIIDSKGDFDLLLLAKELNGYIATSDNGLIKWAQKIGINCIGALELKEYLS